VVQAPNDKQQVAPMLGKLQGLPEELNGTQELLADNGYFSEANVNACDAAGIAPLIALKRDEHHPHWSARFAEPSGPAPAPDAPPLDRMQHRLRTCAGRASYALRKQTVEPVFGIIKSVLGFRQFLTRGLANVRNEWNLVCLAWNLKRMAALRLQ
jgi:IS5 family transposase